MSPCHVVNNTAASVGLAGGRVLGASRRSASERRNAYAVRSTILLPSGKESPLPDKWGRVSTASTCVRKRSWFRMLFLLLLQQPTNLFSECAVPGDPDIFWPTVRPGGPFGLFISTRRSVRVVCNTERVNRALTLRSSLEYP